MKVKPISIKFFAKELAILLPATAVVWLTFTHVIHPLLGIPSQAPVPARTIFMVGLIWWLIRRNGESWADFGLRRPRIIWVAIVLGIAFLATRLFLIQPASAFVNHALNIPDGDYSLFKYIQGNEVAYVGWLAIAWGVGGFAEEMVFRGYLLNRFAAVAGGTWGAWVFAALAQALIFGLGHYYQGLSGILSVGFSAVFSAVFYLIARGNLWPLIIFHGVWDTLGFTLIYLNGAPTTGP